MYQTSKRDSSKKRHTKLWAHPFNFPDGNERCGTYQHYSERQVYREYTSPAQPKNVPSGQQSSNHGTHDSTRSGYSRINREGLSSQPLRHLRVDEYKCLGHNDRTTGPLQHSANYKHQNAICNQT